MHMYHSVATPQLYYYVVNCICIVHLPCMKCQFLEIYFVLESSDSESHNAKDKERKDSDQPDSLADDSERQQSAISKIPVLGQGDGRL